ncbi:hypothetical protein [Kribbella solani]|uniref:hypothetical protein n=1 Tax=Kribbella solani TaxID=236067 RepID=UPI0029A2DC6B|nr:hypothetical protein [Kribbella solani]MDX2969009.1 hypothetical protein [Kribbella solani]
MAEPREKAFVGIDPAALKAMNKDLAIAHALVHALLPKIRVSFSTAQLDTSPIDRILSVSRWIEAELPSLQRRQIMAEQLQHEALQLGQKPAMVRTEWTGNFTSTAAAVARAKQLAAKYKDGKLPPDVWAEVQQNQNDPDFAAAFVKALGPDAARHVVAGLGADPMKSDRLPALANLFATASHRRVFDDRWFPNFPAVPGLLPLMQFGNWDNDLLVHVGNLALRPDRLGIDNERTAQVLAAIARSPLAASRVYQDHFDRIQAMSRGRSPGWTIGADSELGDPLGDFIRAATVDARPLYEGLRPNGSKLSENPADTLTRKLLMDLMNNPQRAVFSGVQGAYASIATAYFDDLQAAIAGPPVPQYFDNPDPDRPGIEAPDAAWRALVKQAMWDPKNAALLSAVFRMKYEENSHEISSRKLDGAPDATGFSNWQNGQVRGWFLAQLNAVKTDTAQDAATYNAKVKEWIGYLADPTKAALFAEAGPAAAAGKAVVDLLKSTGTSTVKDMVAAWFERKPPSYTTDLDWLDDSKVWQSKAADQLIPPQRIRPVTTRDGTRWTGDPRVYEKKYGVHFTTGSHTSPIMPVNEMSTAQLRAYAAWLQDPAVQQAVWSQAYPDILGFQGAEGK